MLFISNMIGCSDEQKTNVLRRNDSNGQSAVCPTCPQKPTNELGDNALAYSLNAFIATKQLHRILDAVINESNSSTVDNCYVFTKKARPDKKSDLVQLRMDSMNCPDYWSGRESFVVTYTDESKSELEKIEAISAVRSKNQKPEDAEDEDQQNINDDSAYLHEIVMSDSGQGLAQEAKASKIMIRTLNMTIQREKKGLYIAESAGSVFIRKNSVRSIQDDPDADQFQRPMLAQGQIDAGKMAYELTAQVFINEGKSEFGLALESLRTFHSSQVADRLAAENSLVILPQAEAIASTLVCGIPVGNMKVNQEINRNFTNKKSAPLKYHPLLAISEDGQLRIKEYKLRIPDCKTPGLQTLNQYIKLAEENILMGIRPQAKPVRKRSRSRPKDTSLADNDSGTSAPSSALTKSTK